MHILAEHIVLNSQELNQQELNFIPCNILFIALCGAYCSMLIGFGYDQGGHQL